MENYEKVFLRNLLENKDNLAEYVSSLYKGQGTDYSSIELNSLFSSLKKQGYVSCMNADNIMYNVSLTLKGKNVKYSELRLPDKEELLSLIGRIDEIEKCFHRLDGQWAVFEQIHDVPKYQEWIQEIIFYLQDIFNRTSDQFIWGTLTLCQQHMNGTDDRNRFNEIIGKLRSIEKNIDKYYVEKEQGGILEKVTTIDKTPMIFISHSSKDEAHVDLIVKLLKDMGFTQEQVFCSTIPGYGIGLSKDIYDTLLNLFNEHNLYVIFVHSPNYYGSAVSLNEMGAAWVLKTSFCSFLLPGFEYSDMKGVVDASKISIKIDSDRRNVQNRLNELYSDLAKFFSRTRDTSIVWEGARDEFIDKMNAIKVISDSQLSEEAEKILKAAEKDTRGAVIISKDLEGVTVQAGGSKMNKAGVRREEAKMTSAVKELIIKGLLEQTGVDIYQITESGYSFLES